MSEIIKLLALLLILVKDGLKLGQVIAECQKEWRSSKPTLRQAAAQMLTILFAAATFLFYASDLSPHLAALVA